MRFTPRRDQQVAIDHAVKWLATADRGAKVMYQAPTGWGKSVFLLHVREAYPDLFIVTPRTEIITGMLEKLLDVSYEEADALDGLDYRMATPITLRNRLLTGALAHPSKLAIDESHHHSANTYQQLDLLTGLAPAIGCTATPYRGSPKGTRELREAWGEPVVCMTYEEAAEAGIISIPRFSILPLVDDDVIELQGGEFSITSIDGATVDRLGDMADHAKQWFDGERWDRPTIFAVPSSECCKRLQRELSDRGLPSGIVGSIVDKRSRPEVFAAVQQRLLAVLHINVVTEGVDLPLRRLVDLAPTMSPVKWVQQLGRITRPSLEQPEYVCTNRNILRHSYALEGCVPIRAVVDAEAAFPATKRGHARALGLEALGRFKPHTAKMVNGATLYVYSMSALVGRHALKYACIVHPTTDPVWAVKMDERKEDGSKGYGNWTRCEMPPDLKGFGSIGSSDPTEKQRAWWSRRAAAHGLDPTQEVSRRTFEALPILSDLGLRFK